MPNTDGETQGKRKGACPQTASCIEQPAVWVKSTTLLDSDWEERSTRSAAWCTFTRCDIYHTLPSVVGVSNWRW